MDAVRVCVERYLNDKSLGPIACVFEIPFDPSPRDPVDPLKVLSDDRLVVRQFSSPCLFRQLGTAGLYLQVSDNRPNPTGQAGLLRSVDRGRPEVSAIWSKRCHQPLANPRATWRSCPHPLGEKRFR
jgi:hypothetical protein